MTPSTFPRDWRPGTWGRLYRCEACGLSCRATSNRAMYNAGWQREAGDRWYCPPHTLQQHLFDREATK